MILRRLMTFSVFYLVLSSTVIFSEEIITEVMPPIPAIEELDAVIGNNVVAEKQPVNEVVPNELEEVDTPAVNDFGSENNRGRVNASNLNIRSGPSSDKYEIVTTLKRDAEVIIHGETEGWYSIAYPSHHPCYIKSSFIGGQAPNTITAEGVAMPVKGNAIPLHVRPWPKATVVGYLNDGDIVTILGRRGSFYTISPPPTARSWVAKKYIAVENKTGNVPKAKAPRPGIVYGLTKKKKKTEVKKIEKNDPGPTHRLFTEFMKKVKDKPEVIIRKKRVATVSQDESIKELAYIEKELLRIREETARKKAVLRAEIEKAKSASGQLHPDSDTTYKGIESSVVASNQFNVASENKTEYISGWVEFIGHGARRPAAYRLVKGGEVLFLLRSGDYNLQEFINKRVEVDGDVQMAPGFEANVLIVKKISIKGTSPLSGNSSGRVEAIETLVKEENQDNGLIFEPDPVVQDSGVTYIEEESNIKAATPIDEDQGTVIIDQKDLGKVISIETD